MSDGVLRNHIGIKIVSDGTIPGTQITTTQGAPITTVTKFIIVMDANKPQGSQAKAIIELMLPQLEMEVPKENVELQSSSVKMCEECKKAINPTMHISEAGPIAVYSCCDIENAYPIELDYKGE